MRYPELTWTEHYLLCIHESSCLTLAAIKRHVTFADLYATDLRRSIRTTNDVAKAIEAMLLRLDATCLANRAILGG